MSAASFDAVYAPLDGFVFWLAQGFELPFIVEPDPDHHGRHCIILTRPQPHRRAPGARRAGAGGRHERG